MKKKLTITIKEVNWSKIEGELITLVNNNSIKVDPLPSNSTSITTNPSFIYANIVNEILELKRLLDLSGDTDEFNESLEEEIYSKFPLFFPNVSQILIPKKVQRNLERYVEKELLRKIDPDLELAIEKCLLFISNLSSTYYSEEKYKSLLATTLHEQTKNKDNTYIYIDIIKALKAGTKLTGPIIEVKTNKEGKETYEPGVIAKQYKLTDCYLKAGLTEYTLKNPQIIAQRNKMFFKQLKEATKNTIANNLINVYERIEIPTSKEILKQGKKLAKEGYITKKGKKLTCLNKHSKNYFSDIKQRSFIEDDIELFEFLTKRGFMIPNIGGEESGGRVTDSFTLMPSWIRAMIKIDGKLMEEADYSALHPNIAIKLYGGSSEFITHSKVAEEAKIDLKRVKVEHLSFFNKNWRMMSESPLFDYYSKNEPGMLESIYHDKQENGYKITSKKMFKEEVNVMTQVIKQLNDKGIYVIYVYDALMCSFKDINEVRQIMNTVILENNIKTISK